MDIPADSPLRLLSQILVFLLNFLDDAVLLGLSRSGLHLPGVQWLSPILMSCTILVWGVRLFKAQPWRSWRWPALLLG